VFDFVTGAVVGGLLGVLGGGVQRVQDASHAWGDLAPVDAYAGGEVAYEGAQ
jgi:hypothetical protein